MLRDPAPWQRKYETMAVCSLGYGLFSQYLFVGNALGLSVLLFVGAFYGLFFYAVQGRIGGFDQWRGQSKSGWLLILPIALLALSYVLFHNELFRSLNIVVLPALIAAQTVLLSRSSAKPWYRTAFYQDVLYLALIKPVSYFAVPFGLLANRISPKAGSEEGQMQNSKLRRIALGLLLAVPPLVVVILLLASADQIFMDLVNRLPELFGGLSIGSLLRRVIVAGIIALYSFGYLWTLLFRKSGDGWKEASTAVNGSMPGIALDPLTAVTLLISFNVVYIVFAAIQFSYLFGAAHGLLPAEAAYAEYARQGFAQLVVVALINLALLLGGLHGIRKEGKGAETARKLSLSLLVGCTIVMLVSAYSRLSLYESAYGYTQTRILVHGFMIFLGLILIVSFVRIWREHFSLAKAYIGLAVAAYVVMNYVNVDAIIAEQNIARYHATGKIDLNYLGSRSSDAFPAIAELSVEAPELQPSSDELLRSMRLAAQNRGGWPSWNLSVSRVTNWTEEK
ncbi:DUF4153 domain-containing protein [Paenibacillus montanisoli]|uniref:Uncharacterized protein n=1 Tax=Paenibacillus montanisoli TaxID=2081970 RepID=A0A328UDH2_9BACL|nr:DUF4173 domain-containing protein [Paenibacillus montanisoli]RAP78384.1 hypothetical protein DL346_08155 [Paenibacillus montanisoli]